MEKKCEIDIITDNQELIKEEIISIITETSEGEFEILPNHTEIIICTIPTITKLTLYNGKKKNLFTSAGILLVNHNHISFCCESITWQNVNDFNND